MVYNNLDLVQTADPLDYSRQHGFARNSIDVSNNGLVYNNLDLV